MSRLRLILRTLVHYRASNLALAAGVAVAAAVLTGSLLVGESVRGSLVSAVERRLGEVDHVVTAPHFFPASLAERLGSSELFRRDFIRAAPVIVTGGSCTTPGTGLTASRVAIYGSPDVARGTCVVSEALAETLQGGERCQEPFAGTARRVLRTNGSWHRFPPVVLRMEKTGNLPADLPIAAEAGELALLRLRIARVAPPSEMKGAFSLYGSQRARRNCWVSLEELGRALDLPDRANTLFIEAKPHADGREGARLLAGALAASVSLEDLGLKIRTAPDGALVVESERILIGPALERRLLAGGGDKRRVFAYLADTVRDERSGAEFPYSMVAGVDSLPDGPIPAGGIVLNRWAAEDLRAGPGVLSGAGGAGRKLPGDRITLEFSVRGEGGLVETASRELRLARVIENEGPGADATLVPLFEGVTDASTLAEWDPPREFGFRSGRIRPRDEEYWKRFGPAPKAFIDLGTARELWGTGLGALTSVRCYGVSREALEAGLLERMAPEHAGLSIRPIRAELLESASGSTDFGELFLGLSFFIVAAAALLVALLMRLHVEQRARQIGTLLALGFTRSDVRGLFAAEGLAVAVAGSLVGVAGAVGYAWLVIAALRTLWVGAVGTSHIELHAGSAPLGIGFAAGLAISAVVILQGVRRIEAASISSALSGRVREANRGLGRARPYALATALLGTCAVGLVLASTIGEALNTTAAFFGAGACLLAAITLASRAWFVRRGGNGARNRLCEAPFGPSRQTVPGTVSPLRSLPALALRNASRNPTRSTLTIALVASAAFITLAVGSMRTAADFDPSQRDGPSGGYSLIVELDVPVPYDISLPEGRRLLALEETALWGRVEIASLRAGPGEDVSCRNLYRPGTPRVMSVPDGFADDGAFSFVSVAGGRENGWELLRPSTVRSGRPEVLEGRSERGDQEPGTAWLNRRPGRRGETVPVIADYQTARWILHKDIGDAVALRDARGVERKGRIVALLESGIFQSELLVGEDAFGKLFPGRSGSGRLLVRASSEDAEEVTRELRRGLADFGVTVETARERMASFAEVANTYISAFQALGGVGLLLGSVGLVVVLARGVVERRGEIALLGAVGFGRRRIAMLFAAENVFLLAAGMLAGAASAAVAVAPELVRASSQDGGPAGTSLTLAVLCGIVVIVSTLLALAAAVLTLGAARRFPSPNRLRSD